MNILLMIVCAYLSIGLVALLILDFLTHRIREKLGIASMDTHMKLAEAGNVVKPWMAKVITVLALWLFWVVAIYGALTPNRRK